MGFVDLDKLLGGGLKPRGVTVVDGRPMMGKTSFLLDVSIHYAQTVGKRVAFFSTEDAEESVFKIRPKTTTYDINQFFL